MSFDKAISFAILKHGAATRKFGNVPYVVHPISVAMRLASIGARKEIVIAALLHDTIEDTETTLSEISVEFGYEVARLVEEVTSDKSVIATIDSPNAKGEYLVAKMNRMSDAAFLIKLADRENNVSDLGTGDIEFSMKYALSTRYIMSNIRSYKSPQEQTLMNSIRWKIEPFVQS
jgi:(p)ppGpp synthase/HD superfamily hydrolase